MFGPQVSKIAFGTCKFWTRGFPDVQTLGFSDSGILGFSDSGILGLPDARSLDSLFLTIFQDCGMLGFSDSDSQVLGFSDFQMLWNLGSPDSWVL